MSTYNPLQNNQNQRNLVEANRQKMYAKPTPIVKAEENDLVKGGEGSKGGKVIGHTKSGKAIYDTHDHSGHSRFTKEDHGDAINAHLKTMDKMFDKKYKGSTKGGGGILIGGEGSKVSDYQHHEDQAFKHTDSKKTAPDGDDKSESGITSLHPEAKKHYDEHQSKYAAMDDKQKKAYRSQVKTTHNVGSNMVGQKTEDAKHRFAAHKKFLDDTK